MGQTGRVRDAPTRQRTKGPCVGRGRRGGLELAFRAVRLSLGAWTPTPIPGAPPKCAVLERSSLIRKGAGEPKRPAGEGCAGPGLLGGLHGAKGVAPAYRPQAGPRPAASRAGPRIPSPLPFWERIASPVLRSPNTDRGPSIFREPGRPH